MFLQETEMEIEDEVDLMMSTDIVTAQMSTKSITFSRAQSGWIFRQDRKVLTEICSIIINITLLKFGLDLFILTYFYVRSISKTDFDVCL